MQTELELLRQKLDKSDEVDELVVWLCCVVNADRAGAAEAEVGEERQRETGVQVDCRPAGDKGMLSV